MPDNLTTYLFARGEEIVVALDVVTGDPDAVDATVAKMRKLEAGRNDLEPLAAVAAEFDVTDREADELAVPPTPAGWTLTVSAGVSATLETGRYLADAQQSMLGILVTHDPIVIEIYEPATVTQTPGEP